MRKIPLIIIIMFFISSCDSKQTLNELNFLKQKLSQKDKLISELQNQIEELEKVEDTFDYYKFIRTSETEINVTEKLERGGQIVIDEKTFNDTLDISDNFFVYKHTSKISQTSESDFESFLRDFDQVKSEYGKEFFVRIMTFYNGQSLPLETENSKTDIHILIQPTELGYENRTFVISDFYNVELKILEEVDDNVELTFEHGRYPRKKEVIIIKPELVKFKKFKIMNKDDEFKDFILHFNQDSIFQISRVEFPMTTKIIALEKDFNYTIEVINKENYRNIIFKEDESEFPEYEQIINVSDNNATIEYRGIENGINVIYFFKKSNSKWKLISYEDLST